MLVCIAIPTKFCSIRDDLFNCKCTVVVHTSNDLNKGGWRFVLRGGEGEGRRRGGEEEGRGGEGRGALNAWEGTEA